MRGATHYQAVVGAPGTYVRRVPAPSFSTDDYFIFDRTGSSGNMSSISASMAEVGVGPPVGTVGVGSCFSSRLTPQSLTSNVGTVGWGSTPRKIAACSSVEACSNLVSVSSHNLKDAAS